MVMSYCTILRFKQSATLNKYLLKKCLKQYLTYRASVYSTGISNNHKNCVSKNERTARRKALRSQIFQDIKQTKRKVEAIIEKENIWTIPNFLCVALWLLIIAGFSDMADGWIARTWTSQASKLGSILDPAADKLLVGTLFLSLAWVGLVPIPLTCLVIVRDVALVSAASYIRYRSLPPPKTLVRYFDLTHATVQLAPTYISKINTGIQLSFVAGTLAAPIFHFVNHPVLVGLCYITALTTLAGGISYLLSKNTYKLLGKKTDTKSSR
nr:probable cardiolipin synthase (CMP-forming) isoform X2 [Megalopta genalis]